MTEPRLDLMHAALEYAKRGWLVFPLHNPQDGGCSCRDPKCGSIGKHPRVAWKSEATSDPKKIAEFWKRWPEANIGIVTGAASGLFVLDVDDKENRAGSLELRKLIEANSPLPETLSVATGTGHHLYFRHPSVHIPTRAGDIAIGLDVRGDGGYIVAPPSLHSNGRRYEWSNKGTEIASAPDWLLSLATTESVSGANTALLTDDKTIPEGHRNYTLFRMVCGLFQSGMPPTDVQMAALVLNLHRCSPPLPEGEVKGIVESASKYGNQPSKKGSKTTKRRSPLYWFPFYVLDYLSDQDIVTMTDYQAGWHIRLTAYAWLKTGILPDDLEKLFKLSGASSRKKFLAEMDTVLHEFEKTDLGGQQVLINRRMVTQYAEALEKWLQTKDARSMRGKADPAEFQEIEQAA